MQPRPIALNLAGRQWRHWAPDRWDHVLGGGASSTFKDLASRQLVLLNTTEYAVQAVEHVCRPGGPFWGLKGILEPGKSRVIAYMAEIDAVAVCRAIESFLDEAGDLKAVGGDLRRNLVVALEKIAFREDTFEDGAGLLLRLAVAENEPWGNNATAQFKGLFPLFLAGTAAGGEARLRFLDDVSATENLSPVGGSCRGSVERMPYEPLFSVGQCGGPWFQTQCGFLASIKWHGHQELYCRMCNTALCFCPDRRRVG